MGRTKQGGSVLSFIIIGVLLLGALAGGVYLYRHAWAPSNQPQTASKPTSPSQASAPAQNNGANNSNGSSQSSNQSTSPNNSSNSSPNSSSSQPAPSSAAPQSSSRLPTTGPADTLATMLALGVVTAAATAYLQSRRALRSL